VPLLIIVLIGVVFYFAGSKTRQEVATEPMAPAVPGDTPDPA